MSTNNLSVDREFRYIVQWFNEWSDLERNDFVPVLVDYVVNDNENTHINGVINSVANVGIKPMSLFQCRIKLFREWSVKWPLEFKSKLKEKIIEIDSKTGEKILTEINKRGKFNGNGNENGSTENGIETISTASISIINEEATMQSTSRQVALNEENHIITVPADNLVLGNEHIELAEQVQMPTQELVPAEVSLVA